MTDQNDKLLTAQLGPPISGNLSCENCGYDLRAHPADGKCPECGFSVAESRHLAAMPRRPTWSQSDPRWRRRILAGSWLLVLLPLMDVLSAFGWTQRIWVPALFNGGSHFDTLDYTLLGSWGGVYSGLFFCMGVVLLFTKERGRRPDSLEWTRRWGVICSYVVLLIRAVGILFLSALVWAGIAALFLSMPLKYQPKFTQLLVEVSTTYLRYGPCGGNGAERVCVASSSIAILLACVPLLHALRSTAPKWVAAILLAPLVLSSLVYIAKVAIDCVHGSGGLSSDVWIYENYFCPALPLVHFADRSSGYSLFYSALDTPLACAVEYLKWGIFLIIAIWLSIAQLSAASQKHRATAYAKPMTARK